ncbi:YicC family protein [Rhodoplanes elegans]|uniref:YicC family protein n=1 Tax=Rhodoplanes elegans TaxID=29408 RepID=A0A327KK74_9BRAD|nr:YicC/YloC family endoribonuclease [Rhodoplanes elegans]MBK5960767.1 YicC family protein [Rhodoplanes elegans]RAI38504.1 YicC family protein [Rhodoplanes elegans]
MALSSMTGFARSHGTSGPYSFAWEIKSVNAKGLDVRLRLPPGWDAVEPPVRARAAEVLSRGTVYATLTLDRPGAQPVVRVNEAVLTAVLATLKGLRGRVEAEPPRLDGILSIKGVVEVAEAEESEDDRRAAEAALVAGFAQALDGLATMRRHEGAALGRLLGQRLDEISALVARAEAAPGRKAEAIRQRLADQVAALMETSERFDADRLHQEAILIASKADVREELDRLVAHVKQAESMIAKGGAVGRRLDFLSQELNREANTVCSKSNDLELTNIGLELKSVVEQFREQVQNLE